MKQFINANGTIFTPKDEKIVVTMEKDPNLKVYTPKKQTTKVPAKPKE